jgi:hypothetical protein
MEVGTYSTYNMHLAKRRDYFLNFINLGFYGTVVYNLTYYVPMLYRSMLWSIPIYECYAF